jgi:rhodanese-related sulfurtransferase
MRSAKLVVSTLLFVAVTLGAGGDAAGAGPGRAVDRFEVLRGQVEVWLSRQGDGAMLIPAGTVKDAILDAWDVQQNFYQIVSVRKPEEFAKAGHLPHAINVYWPTIASDESLAKLERRKSLVVYCSFGNASMISCTILGLLGYDCRSLSFGMSGWNLGALAQEPWDGLADYAVESGPVAAEGSYPVPKVLSTAQDVKTLIKERAAEYLASDATPVLSAPDVQTIVAEWERRKAEYQILDVRAAADFEKGHLPHAIDVPWRELVDTRNLVKLDPARTVIVCSENGQTAQLAATVLNLLGYRAKGMRFGMMDWNTAYVDKSQKWSGAAGYPIEGGTLVPPAGTKQP